jgi:hypothetical protein
MGKMTYKKLLCLVVLFSSLVGLAACGNTKANNTASTKITRQSTKEHSKSIKKPSEKKVPEAFVEGEKGTFEALGETKSVIWEAYPKSLSQVKDSFYHWTPNDKWFQVNTGHYMVADRLTTSGALLRKLQKGTPVKLNGKDYKVTDYKNFEGNGSSDKLSKLFKEYIKQFPKSAYFVQTCLDAKTYGGQRIVVFDVAK